MHKNSRFNIVQAPGNCNRNFVVIDGQRTNAGHMAIGAKVVSEEMPRSEAIELADKLQAEVDETGALARSPAMKEAIAQANALLNNVGLPTYGEVLGMICQVAEGYTGKRQIEVVDAARALVDRFD